MALNSRLTAKSATSALAVAVLITALAGCANSGSEGAGENASGDPEDGVRIAFLVGSPETSYAIGMTAGAEDAGTENGAQVDMYAADYDPSTQQAQCDAAIDSGDYAGIVIWPVSNATAIQCVEAAAAAGVNIVSIDGQIGPEFVADGIQVEGLDAQIYLDPEVMVRIWAEMAVEACAGADPCNLALLTGDPEYPLEAYYLDEWDKQLEANPQLKIVANIVAGFGDPNGGISATQNLLQVAPDVDVVLVSDDDTGSGVADELERQGLTGKVKLLGQGATTGAVQRIQEGKQLGSLVNLPYSEGFHGVELLLAAINGDDIPERSVELSQISPLGEGNLKLWADNAADFEGQY